MLRRQHTNKHFYCIINKYSAIFFYTELWRIYMYAGLLRCCVVILGFIDGLLTRLQRGLGGEPSLEHVGDEYAGQLRIDEGGE